MRDCRVECTAHAPRKGEAGMAGALLAAEAPYRPFAEHVGAAFTQGHRFIDDVPVASLRRRTTSSRRRRTWPFAGTAHRRPGPRRLTASAPYSTDQSLPKPASCTA